MATDPADRQLLIEALASFAQETIPTLPTYTAAPPGDNRTPEPTEHDLHKFTSRWAVDTMSHRHCLSCGSDASGTRSQPDGRGGAVTGCVGWAVRPWFSLCETCATP